MTSVLPQLEGHEWVRNPACSRLELRPISTQARAQYGPVRAVVTDHAMMAASPILGEEIDLAALVQWYFETDEDAEARADRDARRALNVLCGSWRD